MAFENLRLERDGAVATITIDRQKVLNALSTGVMEDLRHAVLEVRHDEAVRTAIITGAGEKAFVAGADINELARLTPAGARDYALRGQHVLDLVANMGKPVIAAVNGYALGGGCELAMACTFRFAADSAVFGQPEVDLGLIPGYGGTQRLPRLVGRARALELILSGRKIKAPEALAIGLVDRVVPAATLLDETRKFAQMLAAKAPIAVRCAIDALSRGVEGTLAEGLFLEASQFGMVAASEDMREGTRAFLEKRTPEFKGK